MIKEQNEVKSTYNDLEKNKKLGKFFGELFSYNSSLKLYHWHVTGKGSYAAHIALDEAIDSVLGIIDRIVETSYAQFGTIDITIKQTSTPKDIVKHCENFYLLLQDGRELFSDDYSLSIFDDYQEAIQQLLYRLKRLQ
ncbi:DUF5856 family protein [Apibacter adventoris]|uniref:DNA starvation/stationary phase protection protein n=1 Tax=Apibacter adventoris TaxID=1679466 RepID=A0A2S8A8D8_9FLAO|nr:DUF5856 family protein [Apibacter adventoris]PQL90837.1 hypothetical protein C4S77_10320 [Apibacter adventoris]PQL94967.1 hypothetical protein C4S76_03540 [Apibacter adventoris]